MLHVPKHGCSMSQPHSSLKNIANIIQSLTVQLHANPNFHVPRISYCIFNKSTRALGSLDPPSSSSSTFFHFHYQKIDKYKWKYWRNISVGKFSKDFTDENIPSVYTEGITMGNKIKTKQKKNDDVPFLPTELPTE